MERARSHQRLAGGRLLCAARPGRRARRPQSHRQSRPRPPRADAALRRRDYYPFLLAGVKVGVALMLAALTWRFVRRPPAAARGADGCSARVGARRARDAARADRAFAAKLGARFAADRRLLPRADRQRALCRRAVAALVAVAAHVGAARSSPCSPCSSRCSTAPSRAGCPITSATPKQSRRRRARCSACSRAPPPRAAERMRSAAAPLRARLRVAAASRSRSKPGRTARVVGQPREEEHEQHSNSNPYLLLRRLTPSAPLAGPAPGARSAR